MEKIKKFLFVNTSTKQTFVKNTFWLFLSEILGRLLRMVLIIYAARILGASGWGIFSYALSLSSLLMIFSDIGLSGLITREVVQKKDGHKTFISTALFVKSTILFISTIVVVVIGPIMSNIPEAKILFPIIATILFFDSIRDICIAINRASEKMERDMVVKSLMNVFILIIGIILIKLKPQPESFAIAYALGSAFGFIIIFIIIREDIKNLISKIDRKLIKEVLQTTWPFAVITLVGSVMANTDVYMLGIWRSASEIGLYSSVQRIQQFMLIIPTTIAVASFPIMSRLAGNDNEQFRGILEKTMVIIMIVVMPTAVGGLMLADKIVPFIFGIGYLGAVPIFRVLMIMLLASFPLILLSNAIFAYNKQSDLTKAYIFGVLANVIINFLLIPEFGAVGSAIATLVSTTVITLIMWDKMKKINYFETIKKLNKGIVATIVMGCSILLLKYLKINVLENIIISSSVYFGSLFLLKEQILDEAKKIL